MSERKFEKEIRTAAEKNQIPFELLYALVGQESSYNPLATSKCGARGLMQLMPATGAEMGLKEHEFFDVEKNLDAGAAYLRRQYRAAKNFITTLKNVTNACVENDYWMFALASYNGGLGYTLKSINICIQEGLSIRWENVAPFYSDERCVVRGKWPDHKQITDYVRKIMANYKKMDSPIK
ncbi:MAG: transglycosylase SLT domain-containing protein [Candidatus Subteraquimicrobiales bacterium]|nr:transglycosylase SLT domain-containing protein [Candidatus Subteraquimicrobiales bacterium]